MLKHRTLFLLIVLFGVLLAAPLSYSGDKWKVSSAEFPKTLDLGGQDWDFKVTIRNTGLFQTSGEQITIKVKAVSNGNTVEQSFSKTPAITNTGSSQSFTLSLRDAFQLQPEDKGTHTLNVSIDIIETGISSKYSKTFKIKWK